MFGGLGGESTKIPIFGVCSCASRETGVVPPLL